MDYHFTDWLENISWHPRSLVAPSIFFFVLSFQQHENIYTRTQTHFQMLPTSWVSSWWKITTGFHSSEMIPNIYWSKGKSHLMGKWLSNSPYFKTEFRFYQWTLFTLETKTGPLPAQHLCRKPELCVFYRRLSTFFSALLIVWCKGSTLKRDHRAYPHTNTKLRSKEGGELLCP